jgi:hypothetical protein
VRIATEVQRQSGQPLLSFTIRLALSVGTQYGSLRQMIPWWHSERPAADASTAHRDYAVAPRTTCVSGENRDGGSATRALLFGDHARTSARPRSSPVARRPVRRVTSARRLCTWFSAVLRRRQRWITSKARVVERGTWLVFRAERSDARPSLRAPMARPLGAAARTVRRPSSHRSSRIVASDVSG